MFRLCFICGVDIDCSVTNVNLYSGSIVENVRMHSGFFFCDSCVVNVSTEAWQLSAYTEFQLKADKEEAAQ